MPLYEQLAISIHPKEEPMLSIEFRTKDIATFRQVVRSRFKTKMPVELLPDGGYRNCLDFRQHEEPVVWSFYRLLLQALGRRDGVDSLKPRSTRELRAGILLGITLPILVQQVCGQTFELLHSFRNSDGANPQAGLLQASDASFYGTTYSGLFPTINSGTVFRVTPDGGFTSVLTFNYNTGAYPVGGLVQGSDGAFYGTTLLGGAADSGTVFRISTNGVLTTLIAFNYNNGDAPEAGLMQGSDGNFYGTASEGGAAGDGTVFKMTPNGTLTTLISFNRWDNNGEGPYAPFAGLVQGTDSNFYGTTAFGGASGLGTVFKMTPGGVLTTLVSFNWDNGAYPYAGLVRGSDGNFYGTTKQGGTSISYGTVFRMIPAGTVTTLASFNVGNGSYPVARLLLASDGNFYGTTTQGGEKGYGTVFQMTTNGALTTLFSFNGSNGSTPQAELVQGRDGNFYGTTSGGGLFGYGAVFRIVMPQPLMPVALKCSRNGSKLILSWPTNAIGFALQLNAPFDSSAGMD